MSAIRRYLRPEQIRELSLIVIIILALLFFATQIENYLSARTFNRISTSIAIIAVVAVGQTLVVLTRNIDLSVGSIVGFAAYFSGQTLAANPDLAPLLAIGVAILFGAFLGLLNGVLVAVGRIPAIVVTLGTLAIYRGILVDWAQARTITTEMMPTWLIDLPRVNAFTMGELEVRIMVALALVVVVVFQLALNFLPLGRRLYAIGSNPDAARLMGLPIQRTILVAYVLCGALAGLAGFMFLARFGTITVTAGTGLELAAVAAVVVGETLAAGSAEVEAAGTYLQVDMGDFWRPDEAFFDGIKDRETVNAMLKEVGGKKVADGNVSEKVRTQKGILRDFLAGTNDRPKVERWTPRWLTFPAQAYTRRPFATAQRSKAVAPLLRRVRPPQSGAGAPEAVQPDAGEGQTPARVQAGAEAFAAE